MFQSLKSNITKTEDFYYFNILFRDNTNLCSQTRIKYDIGSVAVMCTSVILLFFLYYDTGTSGLTHVPYMYGTPSSLVVHSDL